VAGHLLAKVDALADGVLAAGGPRALAVGLAVGGRQAMEAVAADDAHEAAALRGADDVALLLVLEDRGREFLADLDLLLAVPGDLADERGRLEVLGFVLDLLPALLGLLALGAGDLVADHGHRRVAAAAFAEADLDGGVAVAVLGLDLEDGAGAGFDDGDGEGPALRVEDPGHPDFPSEQSCDHVGSCAVNGRRPTGRSMGQEFVQPAPQGWF
jgi:hypothetical protein